MSFQDNTIKDYCDMLGAKTSTPGGGSALGITLQLAVSLCLMVVNFTYDKPGYEKHQGRLFCLKETLTKLNEQAAKLADDDSKTFKALMAAYKLKDKDLINERAKEACLVPYGLYLACEQVETIARELVQIGNKNVISDAKIAADLCISIYPGCKANIEANISSITDVSFVEQMKSIY